MEQENKTWEDYAREYVEGVKEYNETPTWDLIHTAFISGMHELKFIINKQK